MKQIRSVWTIHTQPHSYPGQFSAIWFEEWDDAGPSVG